MEKLSCEKLSMRFLSHNKRKMTSIFLSNVQSLVPKFDEIFAIASVTKPDLMAFCETWLSKKIDSRNISLPGYSSPIRYDRSLKRGGGVCVYCKDEVACKEISTVCTPPSCIECVWVALPASKVVLLTLYSPPNLNSSQHKDVLDYIICQADNALNHFSESNLVIIGDLNNLPTEELETTFGLRQVVDMPTRKDSILDKILMEHIV